MNRLGPEHPFNYRQELVAPLFDLLRTGESCVLVGASSMGKSRLLHFLLRPDVQRHYLNEEETAIWLLPVDCNRLAEISEWGFYELVLTTLTETAAERLDPAMRNWLNDLRREAITAGSPLLARRHVELATRVLCGEHALRLCFVLDEFDAAYRTLSPSALANLRALRDAHRYSISFLLIVRNHPEQLRPANDCEGFYELVSRSILALKPYTQADAKRVIAQLVERRRFAVTDSQERTLLELSGGHPGLIVALFDVIMRTEDSLQKVDQVEWALAQTTVAEECRKLWEGLSQDEQLALSHLGQGIGVPHSSREMLVFKGLIAAEGPKDVHFFSPVFREYVLKRGILQDKGLWLDEGAAEIWVEGRRISDLSSLEYELVRALYHRLDQVCSRREIITTLYPQEKSTSGSEGSDNRIDSLVRHLRKAIEPAPDHPRYLLTVRGRGYRLVGRPKDA